VYDGIIFPINLPIFPDLPRTGFVQLKVPRNEPDATGNRST